MSNELQTVSFHDQNLYLVKYQNQPFVPMRPVVKGMGLAWQSQHKKIIKQSTKFSCNDIITTGADGKIYSMTCIPLKKLNGWLFSINPEKVKPELRDKITLYQEECFEALYNYWHHGSAIKEKEPQDPLQYLTSVLKAISQSLPKDKILANYLDIVQLYDTAKAMCIHAKRILYLTLPLEAARQRIEDQTGRMISWHEQETDIQSKGENN